MFILPPPPRSTTAFPMTAVLEATNTYTSLADSPENGNQSFTAPEGLYTAKDCVFLATPLPHPSDPPPAVINPLAPTNNQPQAHSNGVKLSWLAYQQAFPEYHHEVRLQQQMYNNSSNNVRPNGVERKNSTMKWTSSLFSKKVDESDEDDMSSSLGSPSNGNLLSPSSNNSSSLLSSSAPSQSFLPHSGSFGTPLTRKESAPPPLTITNSSSTLLSTGGSTGVRKKPKNSLAKNNSSFISRSVIQDNLVKRLNERAPNEIFLWANVGRSISWVDLSDTNNQKHDPLMKVLFTKSHPLCHDVNWNSKAINNIDVITGTSSGDVIWMECITSKYNRINKNGDVTRSAVTDIKWVPGTDNLFVTAHADGSLVVFDKDREDGGFAAQGGMTSNHNSHRSTDLLRIIKSLYEEPVEENVAAKSQAPTNPLAVYKVSNSPITAIRFSPNGQMLAIGNRDGYLRLFNLANEELTDVFPSYYGGFLSAAFSPDGKYLATGGQDDMLVIWSLERKSIVARCQGHSSWVRGVQFDPVCTDGSNYRIGSVGDDGRVLLWDFSPKSLNRPKARATKEESTTIAEGNDVTLDFGSNRRRTVLHPFVSQGETPVLIPIVRTVVKLRNSEPESLSDIVFVDNNLIVMGKDGRVWVWDRPNTIPIAKTISTISNANGKKK